MAHTINRILDYKSSTKQKAIQLELDSNISSTYIMNVEKNDQQFDQYSNSNRCNFYTDKHGILHNLYDVKNVLFDGIAARYHKYPYEDTPDYQHMYKSITDKDGNRLNPQILNIIQSDNNIYMIDQLSSYGIYGHYTPNDYIYSWLAQDNGYDFPKSNERTQFIYDKAGISADNEHDPNKHVSHILHGVEFNTIYEIPGGAYTDFSSGEMYGNTIKGKNNLDARYTVNHHEFGDNLSPTAEGGEAVVIDALCNAREYTGINCCNDQVYLNYVDNVKYEFDHTTDLNAKNAPKHFHLLAKKAETRATPSTTYPQIEMIKNLNRGMNTSRHKPTLYRVDIKTEFLDKIGKESEVLKTSLKTEIRNSIRSILEKIQPADCQLFSVDVS